MILFVGDQPSKKNIDPNIPFVGTKSYKTLLEWIWELDIDISEVRTTNTEDFMKRIGVSEIFHSPKIIALGKNAKKYLSNLELEYRMEGGLHSIPGRPYKPVTISKAQVPLDVFELPHPSGLNRKLNDKKWLKQQLKECKKWLNS